MAERIFDLYTQEAIKKIITEARAKKISVETALSRLKNLPYESFSFAQIDHHRHFRKGLPEAIYGPGKTVSQLEKIIRSFQSSGQSLLITRLDEEVWNKLSQKFPTLEYSEHGQVAYLKKKKSAKGKGLAIAVLTAGTSDLPVAEEARITLEMVGKKAKCFYDCGVAGLHRIIDKIPELRKCRAIICIAGMDGVLPSVVAGLVDKPVIAVPTSVGYGANFKGMAPLLTMLNTCSQGVSVVNIDNGFGAACFAALI